MTGPLDRLPTWARDLLVALIPVLLAWGSTTVVPELQGVNPLLAGIVALGLTQATQHLTPITRAYGKGAPADDGPGTHAV